MNEFDTTEYKLQNEQYSFPYHHIPYMDSWHGHRFPTMDRHLWFGFEYLGYNMYLIDQIIKREPKCVLDVGCGDGKFLEMLKEETDNKMYLKGIDVSEEAINLAKSLVGGYRMMR